MSRERLEFMLATELRDIGLMYAIGGRQSLSRKVTIYMDDVGGRPFPSVETICNIFWGWPVGFYQQRNHQQRVFVHVADLTAASAGAAREAA